MKILTWFNWNETIDIMELIERFGGIHFDWFEGPEWDDGVAARRRPAAALAQLRRERQERVGTAVGAAAEAVLPRRRGVGQRQGDVRGDSGRRQGAPLPPAAQDRQGQPKLIIKINNQIHSIEISNQMKS